MSEIIHVYPIGDLKEHNTNGDCWCEPEEDDGVIIHNSLDRREDYEAGIRKTN